MVKFICSAALAALLCKTLFALPPLPKGQETHQIDWESQAFAPRERSFRAKIRRPFGDKGSIAWEKVPDQWKWYGAIFCGFLTSLIILALHRNRRK